MAAVRGEYRRMLVPPALRVLAGLAALVVVGREAPVAIEAAASQALHLVVAPAAAESASRRAKKSADNDTADAAKKPDAADAPRAIEAALKLIETGKAEAAIEQLTSTLAAGNLPPALMAKALYYRGMAYRHQQKPAQAIADLTSALWLKGGLSEGDRTEALRQRAAAYQEAGLAQGGQPAAALPPATRQRAQGGSTAAAETEATGASGGGFNLFENLFGGGSAPAAQSTPSTATTQAASATSTATAGASTRSAGASRGWASNTEVHGAPHEITTASIPRKHEGRFRVQLAVVRSEQEAQAMAAKLKREHAAALAAFEPQIDQAVIGNMGAFYRVRVGPFATAEEGQEVCTRLKGHGLDCLVVTQ